MPDTFDLDAWVHETHGTPFPFRFGGQDFTLPAGYDLRAALALESGNLDGALRILLGAEQWKRFLALETALFDEAALQELLKRHAEHLGTSLGESGASAGSSPTRQRPSKPTSRRTTTLR